MVCPLNYQEDISDGAVDSLLWKSLCAYFKLLKEDTKLHMSSNKIDLIL